jgi:NAD(P)-dependent dehydrogenase (short-subunit alcohol dehydrogenase family)
MAGYLERKAVLVTGAGDEQHRGVAVALAEAGADVAVGGAAGDLAAEAALHSIANEVWALGRQSAVVTFSPDDAAAYEAALRRVRSELGRVDLVVRCDSVPLAGLS